MKLALLLVAVGACAPSVENDPVPPHPMTSFARSWYQERIGAGQIAVPVVWVEGPCIVLSPPIERCPTGATITDDFGGGQTVYAVMPADGTIASSILFHELTHVALGHVNNDGHDEPIWQEVSAHQDAYRRLYEGADGE